MGKGRGLVRGNIKGKRGSDLTQFPAQELRECSSVWLSQLHGPGLDWMSGWVGDTCGLPRDPLTRDLPGRAEGMRAEPGQCWSGPQPTLPSPLSK